MARKKVNATNQGRKRLVLAFAIICVIMILLIMKVGWIHIVKADEYSARAAAQQTKDVSVSADRGTVKDRNGNSLAVSTVAYHVWVRPSQVAEKEEKSPGYADEMAELLSEILHGNIPEELLSDKDDEGEEEENGGSGKEENKSDQDEGSDANEEESGEDDPSGEGESEEAVNEDGGDDLTLQAADEATEDGTVTDGAVKAETDEYSFESIRSVITDTDKTIVKVAKFVNKDTADAVRAEMKKKESRISGVSIDQVTKRVYPRGSFLSHVLGSTNDDGYGIAGIELQYDSSLSGQAGRTIRSTDIKKNRLSYGVEKSYDKEDGLNVILTVDETIQYYVENAIEEVQRNTRADKVMALVMDPETCEILGMGVTPDYDPNDPRVPLNDKEAKALEGMTADEKMDYWNEMWRNPLVNDTYEPGSTFKLITTSIALEDGVTNLDETFYCSGTLKITDIDTLKCWKYPGYHATETLTQAIQNSCNPVQIQLAQRIGIRKYYQYLEEFGITQKTNIDLPGEATPILQSVEEAGPVGLATISYGHGIAVTPVELLTAICAIGNDGMLMKPHIVSRLEDKNGNVIEEFKPTQVRQVLSKDTANEMCSIMQSVVESGTGGAAYLPGYRVGGKTGTANKVVNGRYSNDTYSSFVAMAPMDDPKVAVLVVVDSPKGVHSGSQTAGPGVNSILENTLRYLGVEPQYTDSELSSISSTGITVPSLTGKTFSEAEAVLRKIGLSAAVSPGYAEGEAQEDFVVVDQYPKYGTKLTKNSTVCLYRR